MGCSNCGSSSPCGCQSSYITVNTCRCGNTYDKCCCSQSTTNGCPIQLDTTCVLYHKDNNAVSALTNLAITNGATLQSILEAIDVYIGQIKVTDWVLTCLREDYTIDSLQAFAQAVDTEICILKGQVAAIEANAVVPITPVDTQSINLGVSGLINHTLQADVKISAQVNNLLSVLADGLYSSPQTLNINYASKEISITNGNTLSFASILAGTYGWLGNLPSDPTAIDGQYWWNTVSSQLKIKVNGLVKIITTT